MTRFPAPLRPGDVVGVTAPSSGVQDPLRPRLDVAVRLLRDRGFEVRLGECLGVGDGVVSAPAAARAAELQAMLVDPAVRAVVPPWGGELALDLLGTLDLDAVAAAEPTWLVGYSDVSTLTLPLTVVTGTATVHGPNLMDTPYDAPPPLLHWLDVVTAASGTTLRQGAVPRSQGPGFDDWEGDPGLSSYRLTEPAGWRRLGSDTPFTATGTLLGGCVETVSMLCGSRYGDVPGFARRHAPEGLLLHLEVAEAGALTACRMLHALRLAGWFDVANAVLLGRTAAPADGAFTQHDAVVSALGDLPVPVLLDVDTGHVPPQMPLVEGARATVRWEPGGGELEQVLG